MTAAISILVRAKRVSSADIVAVADGGTFDTVADNCSTLRPDPFDAFTS
ncbi:hypothetical protein [Mycolicibacterium poriferae]|nr:hypothetical protein [Mycolicibacterium poriferae]